jgi:DNA (cytosine-5)-methyltransferase 1
MLSLFSGAGMFDLAAERVGIETVMMSEVEPFPIAVTRRHFPNAVQLGEINKIDGAAIQPVDIVSAGVCCQDVSCAGKMVGIRGERTGLFFQLIRIVREMMTATAGAFPRYMVIEEVPGLLSCNKGEDWKEFIGELDGLGFICDPNILDAQEFGVAQRRKRIFIACINRRYFNAADFADVPNVCQPGSGRDKRMQKAVDAWGGETFHGITSRPHEIKRQHLSEILERDVDERYYLTQAACLGILRRVDAKGKQIPQLLRSALESQAGLFNSAADGDSVCSFEPGATARLQNGKHWNDIAPTIRSDPGDNLCSVAIPLDTRNATRNGGSQGVGVGEDGEAAYTVTAEFQGAVAVSNHPNDSRIDINADGLSDCLTNRCGSGGGNTPLVLNQREQAMTVSVNIANTQSATQSKGVQAVCVQGNIIGRKPENGAMGKGVNDEISFTLTEVDRHAVCYQDVAPTLTTEVAHQNGNGIMTGGGAVVETRAGLAEVYSMTSGSFTQVNDGIAPTLMNRDFKDPPLINEKTPAFGIDRAAYNQSPKALFKPQIDEEFTHSITAQGPNATAQPLDGRPSYVVRRLTPSECLVLQGLPRDYAAGLGIAEPTAEDVEFWARVFETQRIILGKSTKPKTENQLRKWIKNPYSDSACYRAAGNGLCVNVAEFVLDGIAEHAAKRAFVCNAR